jgi:serine/threonine-protein kinase
MLRPGDRIGDWIVDGVLGEGGMGAVYRVHSVLTGRLEAALKVMKPSLEPEARARFVREAEALSLLRHPSVVRVMGFGEDETRHLLYLAMELAEGATLKARLAGGPLPLPDVLRVFRPLASALEYAHDSGIFHRDLKPANVVLLYDGTIRLVDFGVAAAQSAETLTRTGHLGTLAYLPPEVFRGSRPSPGPLDVYGFGLMLHEAITGVRPFVVDPDLTPAAAAAAVGVRKLNQAAVDPGDHAPEPLRSAVLRATDPDPAQRPAMKAMRAMLDETARALAAGAPSAPVTLGVPAPPPWGNDPGLDNTTRVPDMPRTDKVPRKWSDRRSVDRRRGRRWLGATLMIGGAAVLGFLLTWGLTRRAGSRELPEAAEASPSPAPSAPARAEARPAPPLRATPRPSPSPLPTPVADAPSPLPEPTPPLLLPTPRPSRAPVFVPTPIAPAPDEEEDVERVPPPEDEPPFPEPTPSPR